MGFFEPVDETAKIRIEHPDFDFGHRPVALNPDAPGTLAHVAPEDGPAGGGGVSLRLGGYPSVSVDPAGHHSASVPSGHGAEPVFLSDSGPVFLRPGEPAGVSAPGAFAEPDVRAVYNEAVDSSFGVVRQHAVLDDNDQLSLVDGVDPVSLVPDAGEDLQTMIDAAQIWREEIWRVETSGRDVAEENWNGETGGLHDPSEIREALLTSAYHDPERAGPVPGHDGAYVNGQPSSAYPTVNEIFDRLGLGDDDADEAPIDPLDAVVTAEIDLGHNTVVNEATVLQADTFARTTIVMGDYYETNAINQLTVHLDVDERPAGVGFDGTGSSYTDAYNVAVFERSDGVTPGPADPAGYFVPYDYEVDVIDGDLVTSRFIEQIRVVLDDDQVVLTSVSEDTTIETGGNVSYGAVDFSALQDFYDVIIFGGSVYEGNYIDQVSILLDNDYIAPGAAAGGSISSSGNLLYNFASIENIGGTDFRPVSETMSDLVSAFGRGEDTFDRALGEPLDFLGSSHLRILYVTGDRVELTHLKQTTILSDADTVDYARKTAAELVNKSGSDVPWHIETGGNAVVNAGQIIDYDTAGSVRFLGGDYYSDSILAQADLVPRGNMSVFDTAKLAPEVIAFTSPDIDVPDEEGGFAIHSYDMPGDGLASFFG
ncbi:hypothetical protein [Afifella marina]|nr:hypothetical protein [Afifella marina]MBK1625118.1 hypothetical protein [Afifella marina DSM 2698]MBK1627022.1 hypothetical protein [Afifella marina]MBK5919359.1 hypothetical protein [Afifella marina]RAI19586.1 hypothetical protein CH311_12325 [Afifella marina DSM 2698]